MAWMDEHGSVALVDSEARQGGRPRRRISHVPLDEVLAFRNEHGYAYRRYRRKLREFVRDLSLLDEAPSRSRAGERREAYCLAWSELLSRL
jgi:hypothetical protein